MLEVSFFLREASQRSDCFVRHLVERVGELNKYHLSQTPTNTGSASVIFDHLAKLTGFFLDQRPYSGQPPAQKVTSDAKVSGFPRRAGAPPPEKLMQPTIRPNQ